MPNFKAYAAAIVMPGLMMSNVVFAEVEAGSASAQQCEVTVDRSQVAGTYDLTRQVFEEGGCICYLYTGPKPQADSVESAISELLNSRACPNAKVMAMKGALPTAAALGGLGAGLGGAGVIAPVVAGVGAAAALATSDNNSSSP